MAATSAIDLGTGLLAGEDGGGCRLGIDQPAGWWPTAPRLKSFEAAGFRYVQLRMPPRSLLADLEALQEHANALRDNIALTGLELILHAPDDLLAGTQEHDRQLDGALTYASLAGSSLVVYHGARIPLGDPRVEERLGSEERSLRVALRRASSLGVRLAIENLAPVYDEPVCACHDPSFVSALVERLDSPSAGMCLDFGHANIVAGLGRRPLLELVGPVLERVIVFHVHDNFGADLGCRGGGVSVVGPAERCRRAGWIEPRRLDLHLAPGAGSLPWDAVRPLLLGHRAPLQLEVHPAQRPEPATLAVLMREMLGLPAPARTP